MNNKKHFEVVAAVIKKDDKRYVIKTKDQSNINEVVEKLKTSNILEISIIDISLNDIFLDKVGKKYDEQ